MSKKIIGTALTLTSIAGLLFVGFMTIVRLVWGSPIVLTGLYISLTLTLIPTTVSSLIKLFRSTPENFNNRFNRLLTVTIISIIAASIVAIYEVYFN